MTRWTDDGGVVACPKPVAKRPARKKLLPFRSAKGEVRREKWVALREAVKARDGGCTGEMFHGRRCEGHLEVHHLLPRGRGGKDDFNQLVTLCALHHRLVDLYPLEAKEWGLLV